MIPSINDFTSHWNFSEYDQPTRYIGTLFGENMLVYNKQIINVSELLNDNGRIYNAIKNNETLYVLLNNNNLYGIETTIFKTHKLICKDVKNIFSYNCNMYILQTNGNILNDKMAIIHENIAVVANNPRICTSYGCIPVCNNNNELFEFDKTNSEPIEVKQNAGKFVNMCIVYWITIILNDNNIAIVCHISSKTIKNCFEFRNANCISAVSGSSIGFIYDDNNAVIFRANDYNKIKLENLVSHKSISIPNSPYCAKFNTQNIPYYPKYFMDRFIAFVMSVKYGCNIKLPKYLYFMIADYLR